MTALLQTPASQPRRRSDSCQSQSRRYTARPFYGFGNMFLLLCIALFCQCATAFTFPDPFRIADPAVSNEAAKLLVDREPPPALDKRQKTLSLPTPFDSAVPAGNFTPTCQKFFDSFLVDPNFVNCVPLSLLLQTSTGFFEATKSLALITQVLDASCSANVTACNAVMQDYAAQLINEDCASDYAARNQNAITAYNGMIAYAPLYYAGCQRGGQTGNYCFASTVTDASHVTASYVYYLPLGNPLPSGFLPICNGCLENTFAVFGNYASNSSTPLYKTYPVATQMVDMSCGPNFVKPAVTEAAVGGALGGPSTPSYGFIAVGAALWLFFLT